MEFKKMSQDLSEEVLKAVSEIKDAEVNRFAKEIVKAKTVFVVGAGRSGLIGKAFVMRLIQMGLQAYAVGDIETPAIRKQDLLVAISGSGKTHFTVYSAKAAKERKAKVVAITAKPESELAEISNSVIEIKGKTKIDLEGHFALGTVFELSSLFFFDILCSRIREIVGMDDKEMLRRHNKFE